MFGALTGSSTNLANTAGVVLDLNNFNNMIGPLNGGGANGGNVTLGSGTLRIASGNGNYSGAISGTGGVWRTDGGTQTFNGCNNTYTGATTLQGATISCRLPGQRRRGQRHRRVRQRVGQSGVHQRQLELHRRHCQHRSRVQSYRATASSM